MDKKTELGPAEDAFLRISDCLAELGWTIAFNESDNSTIKGAIIGTEEYVVNILDQLSDVEDYEAHQPEIISDEELH